MIIKKFGSSRIKSTILVLLIIIFGEGIYLISAYRKTLSTLNISIAYCDKFQNLGSKQQCWEDLLSSTVKKTGISDAFLIFDNLYKTEPQFASGCHGYAHRLGEETYQLLIKGRDFDFPPQTAYCGYGFYHGLTEPLLQKNGIKTAGQFCDSKKSQITQILYDACYHGIGHGALSLTAKDKNMWGNAQKMINSALTLCIESTSNPIQRSRCASGVFMELGNNYNQLNLIINMKDPLAICREQQEFGKMDCYTQMNGVLNMIAGGKLRESAKFVEAIEEDKYAIEAIITLAAPTVDITKADFTEDINICRDLQSRLRLPCIKGFVLAFLLKGLPGVEYEQAIDFCKTPAFSEDERESCNELLLRHSSEMYSASTMKIICDKVQSQHKENYCNN